MRIVDDDRYLGNATYPQVIDEATIERLRSRKASRNTQTSTDRQSGIYLLKVPIVCPSCGNSMHRLQDTRCKCTQKWVCNQCHIQIKKSESENISANVRWGKAQSAKEGSRTPKCLKR